MGGYRGLRDSSLDLAAAPTTPHGHYRTLQDDERGDSLLVALARENSCLVASDLRGARNQGQKQKQDMLPSHQVMHDIAVQPKFSSEDHGGQAQQASLD